MSSKLEFSDEFYKAVVDGIKNALGDGPMKATLYLLKFSKSTADPTYLSQRLDAVFGSGAFVLKNVVVKELYRLLSLQYDERDQFEFVAHIERARDAYLVGPKEV